MELNPDTYEKIHQLPTSQKVIKNARYELVKRLDTYQAIYPDLFVKVVEFIKTEFLHILERYEITLI
jgi:adenylate kinase